MILVEGNAKRKLCCQAMASNGGKTTAGHEVTCKASDCMAWRVKKDRLAEKILGGYCGLAGKPE